MWELIQANKSKSLFLFLCMGLVLFFLGYFIGAALYPPDGGIIGIGVALGVWIILSLISFMGGDQILLLSSNAREVTHDVHPQLFNVVDEMKIAANLSGRPKIYIINEQSPNAFATGRKPEKSSIAVTAGLLSRLNRDELQGVIAHEMSHIMNRDILFVTFAGVMLGSIVIISDVFLRGMWLSGGSGRRYGSSRSLKVGGQAQLIIVAAAILFAILSPILARLFYFAISRRREYLADANAARLTRYPEGLASALEKIASSNIPLFSANKITAPMYISDPLGNKLSSLYSTHPPISERIKILRTMAHGANYSDYQKAYAAIKGRSPIIVPRSGLRDKATVPIRKPSIKGEKVDKKEQARNVGDLMRAVNGFAFLICACGLKMKMPPDYREPKIKCPRCGRENEVPLAELAAGAAAIGAAMTSLFYSRRTKGWESFHCSCGRLLQLAPTFSGSHVVCPSCGRKTIIKS
ncbi:MAG: M48 family metallopeptidase [Acidobacteriota bacterium]